MSDKSKFLIDKLDIKICLENSNKIREQVKNHYNKYYDNNTPAINYTSFVDIKDFINPKYLINDFDEDFILFKETMPHIDVSYSEFDFLTIMVHIDGGPFYFGDTHLKKEYKLEVGDVFRVRTMNYHWVNTPHIEITNNKNFCIALQYTIEKTNFNKIANKILSNIKSN